MKQYFWQERSLFLLLFLFCFSTKTFYSRPFKYFNVTQLLSTNSFPFLQAENKEKHSKQFIKHCLFSRGHHWGTNTSLPAKHGTQTWGCSAALLSVRTFSVGSTSIQTLHSLTHTVTCQNDLLWTSLVFFEVITWEKSSVFLLFLHTDYIRQW